MVPSSLPGMDPLTERFGWKGLHVRFTTAIADALTPHVRPKLVYKKQDIK